jgi:hypothetical protein
LENEDAIERSPYYQDGPSEVLLLSVGTQKPNAPLLDLGGGKLYGKVKDRND